MKYDINHEFVSISSHTAMHRIILLHGWGADAEDLLPLGKEIKEKTNIDFEIISMRANGIHPSGTGRQWYSLYPHDWNGAENAVRDLLGSLKTFDTDQISLKKTILIGFSQGAAMAIDAGIKLDLGLIVSCSGYPHPNWTPDRKSPPLIVSHGIMDDVVPINLSRTIFEKVKSKSSNFCKLIEFNGYHEIDLNLIEIITLVIQEIF